jgi:Pilus assembly protein, PilO
VKRKPSARVLYGAVAGGLLVYALFGWFVLVSPKRSEAGKLKQEVAAAEQALSAARLAAVERPDAQPLAVADIFRLAKAMPAAPDMPGILLELSRIAGETGITFSSISPQGAVSATSYQSIPIDLVFDGNFYELSDFLFRLRTLVGVRNGELHSSGRLFAVQSLAFAESVKGFPDITASLTVNAYVYGTAQPATSLPAATPPTEGTTTSTSTTPAAETPPPPAAEGSSEASAAGATP